MQRFQLIACSVLWVLASVVQAQGERHAVEPFVGEHTFLVARFDVHALDARAIESGLVRFLEQVEELKTQREKTKRETAEALAIAADWREQFAAAGGKAMYLHMHVGPVQEPFIVVPMAPGADQDALITVMKAFGGEGQTEAVVLHNCVVASSPQMVETMEAFIPADRPEIAAFLRSPQRSPIELFFAPSMGVRGMMGLLTTQIPDDVARHAASTITQDMKVTQLSLSPWPKLSFELVMQGQSVEAAGRLNEVINGMFNRVVEVNQAEPAPLKAVPEAMRLLTPKLAEDKVTIALDHAQSERLLTLFVEPLKAARTAARQVQTVAQVRQLTVAALTFAMDNDTLPTELDQLRPYVSSAIFLSPLSDTTLPADFDAWDGPKRRDWLARHASFVLVPYPNRKFSTLTNTGKMVLFIEKSLPNAERVAIGFADGHVESLPIDEAGTFIKERTGKSLQEWVQPQ